MKVPAILCVDDDNLILLSLKQELRGHFRDRFLYETATSAEEGFQVIQELEAEGIRLVVLLSDWQMPGMKGDEFLSRIRQSHPEVHTIMVTGHATQEALSRIESGDLADVILIKPWRTEALVRTIEDLTS